MDLCVGCRRGFDKDIFDHRFPADIEPDIAVDSAVGQIIDHVSKRRDCLVFGGIELYCQPVLFARCYIIGDLIPEAGITASMGSKFVSVDIYGRDMGSAVELQEEPFSLHFLTDGKQSAVAADHFIVVRINVMQSQHPVGVRKPYRFAFTLPFRKFFTPLFGKFPVIIKPDHSILLS